MSLEARNNVFQVVPGEGRCVEVFAHFGQDFHGNILAHLHYRF